MKEVKLRDIAYKNRRKWMNGLTQLYRKNLGNEEDSEEEADEQEDVELEDGEEEAEDEHLAEVGSVENNFKIENNDKHTDSRPIHHIMGTSDQLLL